jgi:hypothetical protein
VARAVALTFVLVAVSASLASARAVTPRTVEAHSGSTRAVLVYFPYPNDWEQPRPRLRIFRSGRQSRFDVVRPHPRDRDGQRVIPYGLRNGIARKPLIVRDLDGDREPEVLLDLWWGGNRCCLWTRVYRFDPVARRFVGRTRFWGNFQDGYRLRDLDDDGRPELLSADGRIESISSTYEYASPIQIWAYRRGQLVNVTRGFRGLVAADGRKQWAVYLRERRLRRGWVRPPLAAWVADEYLLDRSRRADRVIALALRRGELDLPRSDGAPTSAQYVRQLRAFLRRAGYDTT